MPLHMVGPLKNHLKTILKTFKIKARCAWKGRSTGCFLKVVSFSEASFCDEMADVPCCMVHMAFLCIFIKVHKST
jgi:hypothetical protein